MNFAEQSVNAKSIDVCPEEERKMVWMRETRTMLFMQMELAACRNELDWLIKCYLCAVNGYPEENCCPLMPLPVPPGYHINL